MFRVFVAQLQVQEITTYYTYRLEIHCDKSIFCTLKDDEALKKHELIQKHNMQQDEIRKQVITVIFPRKQIIPFYQPQYISTCTTKETNTLSPVPRSARKTAVLPKLVSVCFAVVCLF